MLADMLMSIFNWTTLLQFVGVKLSRLKMSSFQPVEAATAVTATWRALEPWVWLSGLIVRLAWAPVQFPLSVRLSQGLNNWIQVVAVGVGVMVGEEVAVSVTVKVALAKVPVGVAVGVGVGTLETAKA